MTRVKVKLKVWEDGYHFVSYMQKTVKLDMSKEKWMSTDYDTQNKLIYEHLEQDDYFGCENVRWHTVQRRTL